MNDNRAGEFVHYDFKRIVTFCTLTNQGSLDLSFETGESVRREGELTADFTSRVAHEVPRSTLFSIKS